MESSLNRITLLRLGSWGDRTFRALTKGKKVYITMGMAPQDGFEPPTQ
jgi:hypothetical protein